MTEQLADISARIEGTRQLRGVVNAMKGIASARAHVARTQVKTVDNYETTIAAALAGAIAAGADQSEKTTPLGSSKVGILAFCAEQGFAGAFSERVLENLGANDALGTIFIIGTRGLSIARARGIEPDWTAALPSHTSGIPRLADEITTAIYRSVNDGDIDRLDVIFTGSRLGRTFLERQSLFPLDLSDLPMPTGEQPLMQVPIDSLIDSLSKDYFHALVCKITLHAFAAENEVRMETMSAAGNQITRELESLEATLRRTRQEAITAEIIELSTGATSYTRE